MVRSIVETNRVKEADTVIGGGAGAILTAITTELQRIMRVGAGFKPAPTGKTDHGLLMPTAFTKGAYRTGVR
jgi:hypothetical protein